MLVIPSCSPRTLLWTNTTVNLRPSMTMYQTPSMILNHHPPKYQLRQKFAFPFDLCQQQLHHRIRTLHHQLYHQYLDENQQCCRQTLKRKIKFNSPVILKSKILPLTICCRLHLTMRAQMTPATPENFPTCTLTPKVLMASNFSWTNRSPRTVKRQPAKGYLQGNNHNQGYVILW